ncbi:Cyclin CCL1 [Tolypocladium capitatum]|uniref:Cyclin CCL1 n=1 Tax=Tolypocladium capitatum TaxID=45235 RepID=A0A2K3QNZ2_9HYPO|nr:Cyclin CCL1 [Tolypocladium capitatum]
MAFTKKIGRARQWAGEKMGAEAKTAQSDEFRTLEAEMGFRQNGMENLQKSAAVYVKWESRRCDAFEDKSRSTPFALLGRSMTAHGNDFEPDSEFGHCLAQVGRANERISDLHTGYVDQVSTGWLQHLERSVTMMKEYLAARKKLEGRRLAYDASVAKMHKAKRDDFRIEEEMRVCKTKFDDSSEDVLRRMQDIKDTEVESTGALTSLLDAELAYHERAADELRRARQALSDLSPSAAASQDDVYVPQARSNTARSWPVADADEAAPTPRRVSIYRLASNQVLPPGPPAAPQPRTSSVVRAATVGARSASSLANARAPPRLRNTTDMAAYGGRGEDVLTDDESVGSDGASLGWGNRSASSTTSHDSFARFNGAQVTKKPRLYAVDENDPEQTLQTPVGMATEDERYRQSSQFRLWSWSPSSLRDLRRKTNSLAKQQISARISPTPDFLTPDEETRLVKFFTVELIRAAQFCELPTEIRSTAAMFLRRFYITNSVMTYPPTELLKTSLFFGSKAEGFYHRLGKLAEKFPNTTSEQILAGEFLLCQGIRFAFDVRHPFRALEGAVLELRRRRPGEEARIVRAHARAREILKFSALVTDVYFHYTPSQIMLAAVLMVDPGLVEILLPKPQNGNGATDPAGAHAGSHEKTMTVIESCRAMLEEEPPERMAEYWDTPDIVKSMKPLRKKLQKCRDPDRADLVALQRARREQASGKAKKPGATTDAAVFGDGDARDAKRRRIENEDGVFGLPLMG